jgi:hypothetical protein
MKSTDYNPEYVEIDEVPSRINEFWRGMWKERFLSAPKGMATKLKYNTRQRAHQVRNNIHMSARYWGIEIYTRIIHAQPEIHGEDGWLVYWWKNEDES